MQLGRRAFLKLSAILSAAGVSLRAEDAFAGESAVGIHRATRNTLLGAIGAGLREMQTALTPFKGYVGRERIRFRARPPAEGTPFVRVVAQAHGGEAPAGLGGGLTRERLGELLYFANGDTGRNDGDPYKLRAAPSAGALYAGEMYVLARTVAGLDAGVYYYDVGGHELVRTGDLDAAALADVFEDAAAATAAALVCLSNLFERYEQRYSNRGYRYALLDTGHIGENLRLASAASSQPHFAVPRFCDDRLHGIVGIDGASEAICAVHALGAAGTYASTPGADADAKAKAKAKAKAAGDAVAPTTAPQSNEAADSASPQSTPARRLVEKGKTGAQITTEPEPTLRYHDATKLVWGEPKRSHRKRDGYDEPVTAAAADEIVALAEPSTPVTTSAAQCIVARRSPKAFAPRPIAAAQLGFVTRAALPVRASSRSLGVELWLAVHRVEGVDQGLYRYVPERGELAVLRKEDLTETLPRACLGQAKAADASAGFLMIGHLRAAATRYGERSYRDLLIEAGEIGERIYLAAEALGLSARNLAAFLDEDLNLLLGLDGQGIAVVHLTMLGHGA